MSSRTTPTYNPRASQRKALVALGIVEKRPAAGQNVSHAMNATKRLFKPNLQKATIVVDGKAVSVRVDTRTLRSLTKAVKERAHRQVASKSAAAKPAKKATK